MSNPVVYILDDEEALLELHSEIASLAGYEAQCFDHAPDFFEQVTEFAPRSLMLLDLQMPEMDGIEVMRRLAQIQNPPSVILVSGHDQGVLSSAEKLCRAHGLELVASLSKPLSIDELLRYFTEFAEDKSQKSGGSEKPQENFSAEDLLHAIRSDQLFLQYQPQINIATGQLHGVEALVRWRHPDIGIVHLERLISIAEEKGVIGELTHWVIENAIQQSHQWQQFGLDVNVSINISAADITSLVLPEQLVELLEDKQLDPDRLTLEITESALMGELVTSLDILTRLRLKGIRLSIDDFGTGYSSLSLLHRVPFTELKIDRSFTSNICGDEEAKAIVKTCIVLGHELNMNVVAEGVENQQHYDMLKEMGCDVAQGYYISKPMPGSSLYDWVKAESYLSK